MRTKSDRSQIITAVLANGWADISVGDKVRSFINTGRVLRVRFDNRGRILWLSLDNTVAIGDLCAQALSFLAYKAEPECYEGTGSCGLRDCVACGDEVRQR